jgi:hypothetical protein
MVQYRKLSLGIVRKSSELSQLAPETAKLLMLKRHLKCYYVQKNQSLIQGYKTDLPFQFGSVEVMRWDLG